MICVIQQAVALVAGVSILVVAQPEAKRSAPDITPEPGLQRLIDRAITVAHEKQMRVPVEEAADALSQLDAATREDQQQLVDQLLYYAVTSKEITPRAAHLLILHWLRVPQPTIAVAASRHLDSDNEGLRTEGRRLLRGIDRASRGGLVANFDQYPVVDAPPELIRYMFETAPGLALEKVMADTVQDLESRRPVLWAHRMVDDVVWKQQHGFLGERETTPEAIAQLEKLSVHEAWWARLYAAAILKRHPEFRTPDLVARLKKDAHALARQIMDGVPEADRSRDRAANDKDPASVPDIVIKPFSPEAE